MGMEPLKTVAEMAAILAVSDDTVRRMADRGEIPGYKIRSIWRFQPETVLEHLAEASQRDPWAMSAHSRNARRIAS